MPSYSSYCRTRGLEHLNRLSFTALADATDITEFLGALLSYRSQGVYASPQVVANQPTARPV